MKNSLPAAFTFLLLILILSINYFLLSQEDEIKKETTIPNVIPSGFVVEEAFLSDGFSYPVQIAFLPDGKKLVANKAGIVWLVDTDGYKKSVPFADLTRLVLNNIDKGLLSLAVDPEFESNKWIYFLYTVDPDSDDDDNDYKEAWGRLERYRVHRFNPEIIDEKSKQILIGKNWKDGIPFAATDGSHAVGCIRFGEDNSLLISAGDGANFDTLDAGGLNPSAFGDNKLAFQDNMGAFRAQSLNSLAGKILRLNKETGEGLSSNPFYNGDPKSTRSKIWAYGLRNPFRFVVRPGSGNSDNNFPGTLYVSDVGWGSYEELNISKTGGENFGWPLYEGIQQTSYKSIKSTFNGNTNVINPGNEENPSSYSDPLYWWSHDGKNSNPEGWIGSCSIVGNFYTGSAYPEEFKNNLFIMDYGKKWIRALEIGADGSMESYKDFIDGAPSGFVNMEADPVTGDFYLVIVGNSSIWRITYPAGNHNPVINADVSPLYGKTPLTVEFDASESFDPDDDDLSYFWDFGNGFFSNSVKANHTYYFRGEYNATLTVEDDKGGISIKNYTVFPGKNLPDAAITSIDDSSFFSIGETLIFEAEKISANANYKWEFDFVHDDHIHPAQYTYTGSKVEFFVTVPHNNPGEHYHWMIRLTVSQQDIFNSDTISIFPKSNLKADSIWFTPVSPVMGENFTANISIKNIGEVPSVTSEYELMKGSDEFNGTIPPINANQNLVLKVPLDEINNSSIKISFTADPENSVYETDENDNSISSVINASPATDISGKSNTIPYEFRLEQNYPNPFNPETIISYAVAAEEKVSIEIFNILGDKVVTLVNERKSPGYYQATFDANNFKEGRELTSGIYFYLMKAGEFKEAKKFLLLK